MNFDDELLINDKGCPILTELLPIDSVDLFPEHDHIITLSNRVEQLSIEVNTQSLKVEIEKIKRQKFQTTLKHVKRETISTNCVMSLLQHDVALMTEQVGVINNLYASETSVWGLFLIVAFQGCTRCSSQSFPIFPCQLANTLRCRSSSINY